MVIIGTDNGSAIFFRNEGDAEVYRWDTNSTFVEANFKWRHHLSGSAALQEGSSGHAGEDQYQAGHLLHHL